MVGLITVVGVLLVILFVLSAPAILMYQLYVRWSVKSGRRGVETKWAAELVSEADEPFIRAMRGTPKERLTVFGQMADSKEELRKLVVTHYEQKIHPDLEDDEWNAKS